MTKPKQPQSQPPRPDEDDAPQREAGDRPAPTPGHIGNVPDDAPAVGNPMIFPPTEPD